MTPDLQLAHSQKYLCWGVAELRPGLFALYNHNRQPVLVTESWDEVLAGLRAKLEYKMERWVRAPAVPGIKFNL